MEPEVASPSAPQRRPRKEQAIHVAAQELDAKKLQQLLDQGADPNARDEYKITPLMNVISFIADDDAEKDLETALECLKALLKKGASTKKRSVHGVFVTLTS
jgi:ankyrin repeat protein